MNLRQPTALDKSEFTYSAYKPFTNKKKRIQKFKETGIHNIFIKTNQIKLVFSMTWLIEILKI